MTKRRRYRRPQMLAAKYASREDHPALFMEMRLGKTLVAIRRMKRYVPQGDTLRLLIVAPSSALGAWKRELGLEGETDIADLRGTATARLELMEQGAKWNLINKEGFLALPEIADVPWDAVVLDESFIRRPKSQVTKFFLQHFRDVPHRWLLTGRPNPESDMEFWTQLAFLDGKAFNCRTYWQFRARYYEPPRFGYDWTPRVGTSTMIKKEVARRAFVMRRQDAGIDVPKIYQRRLVRMPKAFRKAYKLLQKELIVEIEGREISRTKFVPVQFTWLRQMCGGFVDGELIWQHKMKELGDLLAGELAGESVVVWFSYNDELEQAKKMLEQLKIPCEGLTGEISPLYRETLVKRFQRKDYRVILLQYRIAETGMSLDAADTAIYYSTPLGTQSRIQTEDRILDVRKKNPLLILDLCVEDSVDELLLDALQEKDSRSLRTLQRVLALIRKGAEHG